MQKAVIQLETLACPSCLQKIEKGVKKVKGVDVESVEVLFNASRVRTDFDSKETSIQGIEQAIEVLGYPVVRSQVREK